MAKFKGLHGFKTHVVRYIHVGVDIHPKIQSVRVSMILSSTLRAALNAYRMSAPFLGAQNSLGIAKAAIHALSAVHRSS